MVGGFAGRIDPYMCTHTSIDVYTLTRAGERVEGEVDGDVELVPQRGGVHHQVLPALFGV